MPFIRALVAVGILVAAAATPLASAASASAAAPTTITKATGTPYVALGDSYAAGFGLADPTEKPVAGCSQSGLDYPHRVAEKLHLALTDVSCSGATTADVVDTRQLGAAPQIDALGPSTRLVTISIGGNDTGLFETASSCIALEKTGPVFGTAATPTCKQNLVKNGHDSLAEAIDGTVTKGLHRAFAAVSKAAPNARVVVVGYPAIFPDRAHTPRGGCFRPVIDSTSITSGFPSDGFPFTDTDVAYLATVQAKLDRVMGTTARAAGFTYVSTLAASQAHSGCATTGSYLQGITLTASDKFRKISLQPGALHPNARGAAFLADQAAVAARAALEPGASTEPAVGGGVTVDLLWIVGAGVLVAFVVILLLAGRSLTRRRRDDA